MSINAVQLVNKLCYLGDKICAGVVLKKVLLLQLDGLLSVLTSNVFSLRKVKFSRHLSGVLLFYGSGPGK